MIKVLPEGTPTSPHTKLTLHSSRGHLSSLVSASPQEELHSASHALGKYSCLTAPVFPHLNCWGHHLYSLVPLPVLRTISLIGSGLNSCGLEGRVSAVPKWVTVSSGFVKPPRGLLSDKWVIWTHCKRLTIMPCPLGSCIHTWVFFDPKVYTLYYSSAQ